ncbi:MAG: hypothetical protein H0U20_00740 [Thermoleophilaceae bacterium]|nr:hypothetical protein [Thermoleophilaceae bacterium]
MTLTLGGGPLASAPGGSLNFSLEDAPKHLLLRRRPKAMRLVLRGTLRRSAGGRTSASRRLLVRR